MRLLPLIALCLIAAPVSAGEISSAYTDLDTARDCVTFSAAAEGEGDWADMVCSGYRGYPVLIYYDDARESLFYGFPPGGDLAPAWESFSAFNSSGPTIEWRIDTDGDLSGWWWRPEIRRPTRRRGASPIRPHAISIARAERVPSSRARRRCRISSGRGTERRARRPAPSSHERL